ncbi:MAG: PAN domain-containing protein [Deltaproteobacteria bacterium]|nr:PAN domain-containing protein [Deltaproteobacteria bacterium]
MAYAQAAYDNTDLPGKDYKVFYLDKAHMFDCMKACLADPKCKAWTYVKPGYQGPKGRCYLKSAVPPSVPNKCCMSGPKICNKLAFATTSPLPSAVIGGEYNYRIKMSVGEPPYEFCPMMYPPDGKPPKCDNSPGQRFSMPLGLTLSRDGLISGQLQCLNPQKAGTNCGAGYRHILIQVRDHCSTRPQVISKKFWINIKQQP